MFDCAVCTSTANLVKRFASNALGRAIAVRMVMNVCTRYQMASQDTCAKIIDAHKEHFLWVLKRTTLTGRQICERLDYCEMHSDLVEYTYYNYDDDDYNLKESNLRIAHITDVHLDLDYRVGSEAECGDVICCHEHGKNVTRAAGKFGDYKCDTPGRTVRSLLNSLNGVDMVVFTGDMAAHDVWSESKAKAMLTEGALSRLFHNLKVPVFPVIGNHETVPANSFPYGNLTGPYSSSWLYSSLALQWLPFLDQKQQREFVKSGRYTYVVEHLNLMVIGMNTNIAYLFNVWRLMYYPDTDPDNHLAWLEGALAVCKRSKLKAILLGHHPPGEPDISTQWSRQFVQIVQKYNTDIHLMLFGHTHLDSFRVFSGAQQVAVVSPSVATWTDTDPCYRILTIRDSLVSHETWKMDLMSGEWCKEYSFSCTKPLYECYSDYLYEIKTNSTTRHDFISHHFKSSVSRIANCTENCQNEIIKSLEY